MRKVRFYRQVTGSIISRFYLDGNPEKFGTELVVPEKFWDPVEQRVKATKQFAFHASFNTKLQAIEKTILDTYFQIKAKGAVPTRSDLQDALDEAFHLKEKATTVTLNQFMDMFYNERKESGKYAKGSSKVYNTLINKFKAYSASAGRKFDFKDIDLTFFYGFITYLSDSNFATNYLNKLITTLKTLLNDAKERGFNPYDKYHSKKFTIPRAHTTKIYLNEDELMILFNFKFKWPHLRNATDQWLIGAWSGQRDSDSRKFIEENIETLKGKEIIKMQTVKGRKPGAVPLHGGIKKIIELRGHPHKISQQKLNDYMKDSCKEAKIDQMIVKYSSKNSVQSSEVVPKYSMITTHTARRSFATNMFLRGYSLSIIGKLMGHGSERMTRNYICASEDEIAFKVAGDDFFKME